MELEERLRIITEKAQKDKEKARLAEEKRNNEIKELVHKIQVDIAYRINELLIIANHCNNVGLHIPDKFYSDSIYHRVGFMSPCPKYVGYYAQGALGPWDLYVSPKELFVKTRDGERSNEVSVEKLRTFLDKFDGFESDFYEWIDSLNIN